MGEERTLHLHNSLGAPVEARDEARAKTCEREMTGSSPNTLQQFFLHYPEVHCLYVCVVDQQRRAFDFTDNTFKFAGMMSNKREQVVEYTVQHRGEYLEGIFVLDEARKNLKHMALVFAEYLDVIAQQFEACKLRTEARWEVDGTSEQVAPADHAIAKPSESQLFQGGELVFHADRVEL